MSNDLKELPEYWYIQTNEDEQGKIIGTYFEYQSGQSCYAKNLLGHKYYSYNNSNIQQSILKKGKLDASFASDYQREGYIEITFEQFEKRVLNKETTENETTIYELW